MLHGSIAAHHQERKGRGEQCGTRFPNGRAARMRVWVLEPPGHPRELLPFGANPPAGLIELTLDPPRRQTIGEAEDRLFGG